MLAQDGRLFLAVALALFVLPGLVLGVTVPETVTGELPPAGPWIAVAVVAVLISLVGPACRDPPVDGASHGGRRSDHAWLEARASVRRGRAPVADPHPDFLGSGLYGVLALNESHPSVAAAIALLVLTAVGIFLAVRLMLSSPVASAEEIGPLSILRRSWRLSRGNWWRLLVFLLLFAIGALCLLWAIDSVAAIFVHMVAEDAGPRSLEELIAIVSQLVSAALSVVFFVMLARIYAQLSETGQAQASVPSSGT